MEGALRFLLIVVGQAERKGMAKKESKKKKIEYGINRSGKGADIHYSCLCTGGVVVYTVLYAIKSNEPTVVLEATASLLLPLPFRSFSKHAIFEYVECAYRIDPGGVCTLALRRTERETEREERGVDFRWLINLTPDTYQTERQCYNATVTRSWACRSRCCCCCSCCWQPEWVERAVTFYRDLCNGRKVERATHRWWWPR